MKSVNLDSRSSKRLRFASSKERSAKGTANVYRSYKGRIAGGVTSASTRESLVHNPGGDERAKKRQRRNRSGDSKDRNMSAVFHMSEKSADKFDDVDDIGEMKENKKSELEAIQNEQEDDEAEMGGSTFASELDIAQERNASEIFGKFHRKIWIHSRSLPEILHNLENIIDILMSYMLSPASLPERPSPAPEDVKADNDDKNAREEFIVNLATTDILHLVSVLARDLRHEIHPYIHTKILPRIINDLLNPPPPPHDSNKQPIPLDVSIVEASFRTIAYLFRYDFNLVVNDMESMRQYYGTTLGNRRELVRRLASETFAPLIRRMKSQNAQERHIRRVLKALNATARLPSTRILNRTQNDAVDGLAQLTFQLVRGVSGGIHSNGKHILRFLFEFLQKHSSDDNSQNDLVFEVVLGMMNKLCYHSKSTAFSVVSQELFSILKAAVLKFTELSENSQVLTAAQTIIKYLKLVVKVATFKFGCLLEKNTDEDLKPLFESISQLCTGVSFAALPSESLSTITNLLCHLWITFEDHESIGIRELVDTVLGREYEDENSQLSLSVVLSKQLLPRLRGDQDKIAISFSLLRSAAEMVHKSSTAAIEIVFSVVSSMSSYSRHSVHSDGFQLFYHIRGDADSFSSRQRDALLDVLMEKHHSVADNCGRISVALRCVPFLATLLDGDIEGVFTRAADWIIGTLESSDSEESHIIAGMAIEAFSVLSVEKLRLSTGRSNVNQLARRALGVAERLTLSDNGSLWLVRGTASIVPLLRDLSLQWNDADALFDALVPNLRSADHFLRRYSLQILASFPVKNFVVNHADLDLMDDLDEETDFHPSGNDGNKKGPVGQCDLLRTLLDLELSPVSLSRERELLSLVAKVGVLARTGSLPAIYAEAAMNHMLGVFHIKFAPLWPAAQKTVVHLMGAYERTVWPPFEAKLVAVMDHTSGTAETMETSDNEKNTSLFHIHFGMCENWETSQGKDVALFGGAAEMEEGDVPCFHSTDGATVMELVWKAAELSHKITVKHSRVIVPLFLGFLHNQLFPSHGKDQDARELHLEDVVPTEG
jgi:U3 small nucleolar RNA-associated protein 20